MPRPLRLHVPGALYHVTLRGNHRQNIFHTIHHRQILADLIAEVIARFDARLHAYCFMTNHIHALIQVSDIPLGRLMLHIAGRYARTIQAPLHTTGHLFEKRYHPVVVDADEYLLEVLRYIHLNPVRANMVTTPDDYPWSSHHAYLGERDEAWVTTDFALALFHSDRQLAVAEYRRFVQEETGEQVSPFANCNPGDRRILGGDDFAAKTLGDSWRPRSRKTLEEVIEEACAMFGVSADILASSSRSASVVRARAWVAHQARMLRIASLAAVARRLNRDESSLRHGVREYFGGA
jgi:putative transposase